MTLTVKGGTSKADQQEAWYQARKKLEDIRSEMPEGVVGPLINDEYGDVYSLMYAVKGDATTSRACLDTSEIVKRPPAAGADGQEDRRHRQASRARVTSSSPTRASPPWA
jgi:hypothetical protein